MMSDSAEWTPLRVAWERCVRHALSVMPEAFEAYAEIHK